MIYIDEYVDFAHGRVDRDVDSIPDSDTREDDLIELIDAKKLTPAYNIMINICGLHEGGITHGKS